MRPPPTQSPPHAPSESLVGQVLDHRYEVFEFIGVEDVGTVFRTWDHALQRIVAITVLDDRLGANDEMLASLRRQVERATQLPADPNIVTTYGMGVDGPHHYVVTELIRGPSLKTLIKREAPFELLRTVEIGGQIAEALDFAHQHGVVHGGLRPEQVLLSRNGRVKVAGFAIPCPGDIGMLTAIEPDLRAVQYLSPEQARGSPPAPASDIYALAAMLFEMLTGSVPFSAQDAHALALKQAQEQPAAPHRLNQAIPPQASEAILRGLNKNPKARQGRASALISAMQATPAPPQQMENHTQYTPTYLPAVPVTRRPSVAARLLKSLCWTLLRALPYVLAIVIAVVGGSYVYHAVDRTLNGDQKATHATHHMHRARKTGRHGVVAAANGRRRTHAKAKSGPANPARYSAPLLSTPGCSGHNKGPVSLHYIRASQVSVPPGGTVTVDYTLRNTAAVCRDTFLGVTLVSTTKPGVQLGDPAGDVIVQAQPGVHVYQRRLTFPFNAAGQSFDAVFSTAGPFRTHTYSTVRLRHFFTVTS
jgi:serine/threonine protein kinase